MVSKWSFGDLNISCDSKNSSNNVSASDWSVNSTRRIDDKHASSSIEYWFRCMDTDGDGVLSLFELEYFYEEQLQRMKSLGIEALPFEDIACQVS